jgi:hypothetical protein
MKAINSISGLVLGTFLASVVMLASENPADAQANSLSDELLLLDPNGGTLFHGTIPETLTAPETSVSFPVPFDPVLIGAPGSGYVFLTEPAGTPPDAGETPIMIPGPNGPVIVSDVVVSTLANPALPPSVAFISDGDPLLAQIADRITTLPAVRFLPETGAFQDVTGLLPFPQLLPGGAGPIPVTILVRSDVPEPSSVVLAALGCVGLAAWARRKRQS